MAFTPKFRPTLPTPKFYGPTSTTQKFQRTPPTSPTPKFYGPTLPTPPTPKFDPRHPRDLANSLINKVKCFRENNIAKFEVIEIFYSG